MTEGKRDKGNQGNADIMHTMRGGRLGAGNYSVLSDMWDLAASWGFQGGSWSQKSLDEGKDQGRGCPLPAWDNSQCH